MPLSKHYGGKGAKVMKSMKKQYGEKKGEQVFYATENKMKKKMKSYGSLTLPAGCNVGEKRMMEAMKVGAQKFKPMGTVKMGGAVPRGAKGGY